MNNNSDDINDENKIKESLLVKCFGYFYVSSILTLSFFYNGCYSIPLTIFFHPINYFYLTLSEKKWLPGSTINCKKYIEEFKSLKYFKNYIQQVGIKGLYNRFSLIPGLRLTLIYTFHKKLSMDMYMLKRNGYNVGNENLNGFLIGGVSAFVTKLLGFRLVKQKSPETSGKWYQYTQPQFILYYSVLFGGFDFSRSLMFNQFSLTDSLDEESTKYKRIKTFFIASITSLTAQILSQPFTNATEQIRYDLNNKNKQSTFNNQSFIQNTSNYIEYFKNIKKENALKSLFFPQSSSQTRINIVRLPFHTLFLYLTDISLFK